MLVSEAPPTVDTDVGAAHWRSRASYENILVGLLALSAGYIFLTRLGIVFVFPQIQSDLKLSHAQLGLLMGVTSLTWALSGMVFPLLSDLIGGYKRLIILTCIAGCAVTTGVIDVCSSFTAMLLIRAVTGIFQGPAVPLMQAMAARASSNGRVGVNMGLINAGAALFGSALPPVLMTALAANFGWHASFLFLAAGGLSLAVVLAFVLERPAKRAAAASVAERVEPVGLGEAARVLLRRNVLLGLIGGMALISFIITFSSFSPLFVIRNTTMSVTTRTLVLTALGLAFAAGNVFIPALSDRLPRKPCAIAATACVALAPLMLVWMRVQPAAIPAAVVAEFIGGGAMTMIIFVIPGESVPPRLVATTFAILMSTGELVGGSMGPSIAGLLSDRMGLVAAMWFCSALGFVALGAALAMKEPAHRVARSALRH